MSPHNSDSLNQELNNLKALFELMRAGQMAEAQKQLIATNQIEKYLWLVGSIPQFDNVCFTESCDYGHFIP